MKLPKFKNPLQAAADFAQRMAGESVQDPEPAPEAKRTPPQEAPRRVQEPPPGAASVYYEQESAYEEEPPVFRPAPPAKKKAPRRKSTPLEDIRYTFWALSIAVSVAATALAFLMGAIS